MVPGGSIPQRDVACGTASPPGVGPQCDFKARCGFCLGPHCLPGHPASLSSIPGLMPTRLGLPFFALPSKLGWGGLILKLIGPLPGADIPPPYALYLPVVGRKIYPSQACPKFQRVNLSREVRKHRKENRQTVQSNKSLAFKQSQGP